MAQNPHGLLEPLRGWKHVIARLYAQGVRQRDVLDKLDALVVEERLRNDAEPPRTIPSELKMGLTVPNFAPPRIDGVKFHLADLRKKAGCHRQEEFRRRYNADQHFHQWVDTGTWPGSSPKSRPRAPALKNPSGLPELLARLGAGPNPEIRNTANRLGTRPRGVRGLLTLWMDPTFEGLHPTGVRVSPTWNPAELERLGTPSQLIALPTQLQEAVAPLFTGIPDLLAIPSAANRPKVWLKEAAFPLTDKEDASTVELTCGGLDYRTARALEFAYVNSVAYKGYRLTLREAYESRLLNILDDLPGMVVAHLAMLTSDHYLVLAQRGRKGQVDFARGRFSASCEEQWDPSLECRPHETVLRCLSEEWNLDEGHGVEVSAENVRLVAVGREWGRYWNTAFLYVVDLPCDGNTVVDLWESVPPDKAEAAAVGVVSVATSEQRKQLLRVLREGSIDPEMLRAQCAAEWTIGVERNLLHETTGAARIALALAHRYDVKSLIAESKDLWS